MPSNLTARLRIFYDECSLDYPDPRVDEIMALYYQSDLFRAMEQAINFIIVLNDDKMDVWEVWFKELEDQFQNYFLGVCNTLLYLDFNDLTPKELDILRKYLIFGKKNIRKYEKEFISTRHIKRRSLQLMHFLQKKA